MRAPRAELMSAEDLLQALIDRPWLRRAALSCVLPAIRVNGKFYYRRTDVEAWIASRSQHLP